MNFLAHFHLAEPTDASRVGALLGDFLRGTPAHLSETLPEELVAGIVLHRAIDRFTDSHPVFLKAKKLLAPPRRRFAGIIIDLYFDHFLSLSWAQYSGTPLPEFIQEIHHLLSRRAAWLSTELNDLIAKMKQENWLGTYGTIPGLTLTFQRMSERRDFLKPLIGAEEDLLSHYDSFRQAFDEFYPELLAYARGKNPGGAFNSP